MPTIRLALLLCDEIIFSSPTMRASHGGYAKIFNDFLTSSLERVSSDIAFTLDSYDVVNDMIYPPDIDQYDGLLISGSRTDPNEDIPWVQKLRAYVKDILAGKPSLKIFGICFGHQIIALALGASVNKEEWELSVTPIELTRIGRAIFHAPELHLQEYHVNHVSPTPPDAHLLGSSHITHSQGLVIFDPASEPSAEDLASDKPRVRLTSIRVLTFQGHPELTEPIVRQLLEEYADQWPKEFVDDALSRVALATDGVRKVGKAIWGVLGARAHRGGASHDVSLAPE